MFNKRSIIFLECKPSSSIPPNTKDMRSLSTILRNKVSGTLKSIMKSSSLRYGLTLGGFKLTLSWCTENKRGLLFRRGLTRNLKDIVLHDGKSRKTNKNLAISMQSSCKKASILNVCPTLKERVCGFPFLNLKFKTTSAARLHRYHHRIST